MLWHTVTSGFGNTAAIVAMAVLPLLINVYC